VSHDRGAQRRPAVFVDRDGTLNEMVYDETHGVMDSPRRREQVRVIVGAGRFLRELREKGFFISVVSNQPGIAKGTLSPPDLDAVNRRLADLLAAEGGEWDDLRMCPHHPDGGPAGRPEYVRDCACRKPRPGMLLDAARDHGLDLARSWMVGDGLNDIQAGRAAGCRTILVARLKVEHVERFFGESGAVPDAICSSLDEALAFILARPL
jgi:D-glycero-D-manno-heptose 1,7-bisphosphate phosphatase